MLKLNGVEVVRKMRGCRPNMSRGFRLSPENSKPGVFSVMEALLEAISRNLIDLNDEDKK